MFENGNVTTRMCSTCITPAITAWSLPEIDLGYSR